MADFISRVTDHFDELTHTHKKVANYFLYHLDRVAVDTLEALAGQAGVSTTTVIRFARRLGYSGFTELQKAAQCIVLNKEAEFNPASELTEAVPPNRFLRESYEQDKLNIEHTMMNLKEEDLSKSIRLMLGADTLYLLGMRMAFTLAYYSFASWGRVRTNLRLITMTGMEYPEEMLGMKKGDVCIIYAFPRYISSMLRIIRRMKQKQVKVILVTAASFAAAREFADIVLPCRVKTASYQNSYAAPVCLINYFTSALAAENFAESAKLLKDSEELLGPGFYIGD